MAGGAGDDRQDVLERRGRVDPEALAAANVMLVIDAGRREMRMNLRDSLNTVGAVQQ